MLLSTTLLRSLTTKQFVFFSSVFWLACLLHTETTGLASLLDPSVPRLHFEGFDPNISIVPSSFFTYELKVKSGEVLKHRSFTRFKKYILSLYPFAQTPINQRIVKCEVITPERNLWCPLISVASLWYAACCKTPLGLGCAGDNTGLLETWLLERAAI